jgi:hypothetical protein
MKFNLSNALPLTTIISLELNDNLSCSIDATEVKSVGIIALMLAVYYPNIIEILKILLSVRKMRA